METERHTFDEPTPKRQRSVNPDPKPLSFRSYLASAYSFFEEEKLIELESKQPQTCISAITEGSKKNAKAY